MSISGLNSAKFCLKQISCRKIKIGRFLYGYPTEIRLRKPKFNKKEGLQGFRIPDYELTLISHQPVNHLLCKLLYQCLLWTLSLKKGDQLITDQRRFIWKNMKSWIFNSITAFNKLLIPIVHSIKFWLSVGYAWGWISPYNITCRIHKGWQRCPWGRQRWPPR